MLDFGNVQISGIAEKALRLDKCLIGGQWMAAENGRSINVIDPATGKVIGNMPEMGRHETARAITAAEQARKAWAARPAIERADILMRWYQLMLKNIEDLARLLTLEQGKAIVQARGEIRYAASFLRFYAEEARRIYGETIPSPISNSRILVLKQPIGVVACITPWNFPAAMITRKTAPALAVGCTVVVKPAELTPFSAVAIALLGIEAGLPAGCFNLVTGVPQEIGAEMCANPIVRKLSFTGSTKTGELLYAQCASTIKKLSLELGGNAAFIVFDDADIDAAVEGAMLSKFRHSGQTCVNTNRFFVHFSVYDEFIGKFVEKAAKLRVGNGMDVDTDIGPLINSAAVQKAEAHIADATSRGAVVVVGGTRHQRGGTFFEPTVMRDVTAEMRTACEEIFGPVASVIRFVSEDEVIKAANATEYGLAGYFYSRDQARCWRVAEKMECGMVGVNIGFLSVEMAPFGGVKQSGIGREGSHHGVDDFLEMKFVHFGGLD